MFEGMLYLEIYPALRLSHKSRSARVCKATETKQHMQQGRPRDDVTSADVAERAPFKQQ
jgi:hypothetical protein